MSFLPSLQNILLLHKDNGPFPVQFCVCVSVHRFFHGRTGNTSHCIILSRGYTLWTGIIWHFLFILHQSGNFTPQSHLLPINLLLVYFIRKIVCKCLVVYLVVVAWLPPSSPWWVMLINYLTQKSAEELEILSELVKPIISRDWNL